MTHLWALDAASWEAPGPAVAGRAFMYMKERLKLHAATSVSMLSASFLPGDSMQGRIFFCFCLGASWQTCPNDLGKLRRVCVPRSGFASDLGLRVIRVLMGSR